MSIAPVDMMSGKIRRSCNKMTKKKRVWCCGYCRKEYATKKEAEECPDCHNKEVQSDY